MKKAKFVEEIVVTDPDTNGLVEIEIYKHPNGGMFGFDTSYLVDNFDDDEIKFIPDPFLNKDNKYNGFIMLED